MYVAYGAIYFITLAIIICPIIILLLIIATIIGTKKNNWLPVVKKPLKALLFLIGIGRDTADKKELDEIYSIAGYAYDSKQDLFYSILNPWQRKFGFCRLYDEAAAPLGMILDCEPIYFDYNGKKWLIEFWKGQFDLPTGGEVGIYNTDGQELNIPGFFNGTFYHSAKDEELLWMSFTLKKNGKVLFTRGGRHWWLTGFRLGEFSQPSELSMEIIITFKGWLMCSAFIKGLRNAGYSQREFKRYGNTVKITFDKPHAKQPTTRTKATDAIIQAKNKLLCDLYNEITRGCVTMEEKLKAIKEKEPELYSHIIGMGRPKKLYKSYKKIRYFLRK
jgi:hypothetical protein